MKMLECVVFYIKCVLFHAVIPFSGVNGGCVDVVPCLIPRM